MEQITTVLQKLTRQNEAAQGATLTPDGGRFAWIQVVGSFFLWWNTWGIVTSFGVYQTYYEQINLSNASPSAISWIGSLQGCLLALGGAIVGPLFDMGYLQTLLGPGTFLIVFELLMTSLCTQYWQALLAQGIVVGAGLGCLFLPGIAVVPQYFDKRRGLAMGIVATGSSIGGVIYPIVFHQLMPRIGSGWTTRVISPIVLITNSIPVFSMKIRQKPSKTRRLFDRAAWKDPAYSIFAFTVFFMFVPTYVPFVYVQSYTLSLTVPDETIVFYLISFLNTGSLFGRIQASNYTADRIGPLNTLILWTVGCFSIAFVWIASTSVGVIVFFCFAYGFLSGGLLSLSPTIGVALSPDMASLGVRLGMLFIPLAAGLLVGNPIAGAIEHKGWLGLQIFTGAAKAGWIIIKKA